MKLLDSLSISSLIFLLCLPSMQVVAQSDQLLETAAVDTLLTAISDSLASEVQQTAVSFWANDSSVRVRSTAFNRGDISDPLLLLAGVVPGMQVYNRGGNPNRAAYVRLRGATTNNPDVQPLIVIDGLLDGSLDLIDPNDIESITVHREIATTAQYGGRGSAGVIEIKTKGASQQGVHFSYKGQRAHATATGTIPLLDAEAFVARGGVNLGSNTDWLASISQTGSSDNHHLSASYRTDQTSIRASTNYRGTEGVLRGSGFSELSSRLHMDLTLLNDRLKVHASGAVRTATSEHSFEEAVSAALSYNPTAPVILEDANLPFEFDADPFAGYFELIGFFDAFNPVAIVDLNSSTTQHEAYQYSVRSSYDIGGGLSAAVLIAQRRHA